MRSVIWIVLVLMLALCIAPGCEESKDASPAANWADSTEAYGGDEEYAQGNVATPEMAMDADDAPGRADGSLPIELPGPQTTRKIIYNADIDLVVDDFEGVPASVADLAKRHNGFIAQSSIRGSAGEPRNGRWTLRIPSVSYDAVMQDAETIGQLRSVQSSSREVTAEFVDLQARLRNKLAQESRLIEHLDQSTGDLEDILQVERELSRVRGEIERFQGRLNMLMDLTSMSTVVVRIEEIRDYTPEPTQEPGFASLASRAWSGSLSALVGFARGVALVAVALTPWLIVIVPVGCLVWIGLRRLLRRVLGRPAPSAKPNNTS